MKLYRAAAQASIKMTDDPAFVAAIEAAIKTHAIRVAIETGTFDGTGSTRVIAECLVRVSNPMTYVTLEVGFNNWCIASHNLQRFLFVDCRWGCSVDIAGAVAFMRNDDALNNHHKYTEIYIDDIDDPLGFYLNELNGMLGASGQTWRVNVPVTARFSANIKRRLKSIVRRRILNLRTAIGDPDLTKQLWSGESLLHELLSLHHDNRPLVILDSAGGCGFYEFQIMMDVMRDAPFLLLLDDTHHLKHFRSLQHIKGDPRFRLLGESNYHGWAIAWHE